MNITLSALLSACLIAVPSLAHWPTQTTNGIWAQLCRGGEAVFIPLGPKNTPEDPESPPLQACHGLMCSRNPQDGNKAKRPSKPKP